MYIHFGLRGINWKLIDGFALVQGFWTIDASTPNPAVLFDARKSCVQCVVYRRSVDFSSGQFVFVMTIITSLSTRVVVFLGNTQGIYTYNRWRTKPFSRSSAAAVVTSLFRHSHRQTACRVNCSELFQRDSRVFNCACHRQTYSAKTSERSATLYEYNRVRLHTWLRDINERCTRYAFSVEFTFLFLDRTVCFLNFVWLVQTFFFRSFLFVFDFDVYRNWLK